MPAGRPTQYSKETLQRSEQYLNSCVDRVENRLKERSNKSISYERVLRVKIPTIEGLASYLDISRPTIYAWSKKHGEFLYIIERLRATQADRLIRYGLSGEYNATIAKVLLTKHGYSSGSKRYNLHEEQIPVNQNSLLIHSFLNSYKQKTPTNGSSLSE